MFCKKCGKEIKEEDKFCPYCGQDIEKPVVENKTKANKKSSNFGWGLLGFLIPIVGLILFIVWNNDLENKPKGRSAGLGALISVCTAFAIGIIYNIIYFIIFIIGSNIPEYTIILSNFINIF